MADRTLSRGSPKNNSLLKKAPQVKQQVKWIQTLSI